jgi:DNA polymerase-3 subunit delta
MGKLAKGEIPHIFLLAGEEHYYIEKARQRILQRLFPSGGEQDALQVFDGDPSTERLAGLIESAPFFADKNVILVKDTALFREKKKAAVKKASPRKTAAEKESGYLLDLFMAMPAYSYVIFMMDSKADKRRKIYKVFDKTGMVLEAEPVRAWNINEWLQGKLQEMNKDFDREANAYFMGAVSVMQQISLSYLDRELSKLALYTKERHITKHDLQQVFASLPEVSGFAMLDAISAHDVRKALQLLVHQLDDGVYPPLLLAMIVRHVRQLWQAKVLQGKGYRGRQLAKPMSLNPFIAEKVGRAAQTFAETQLKKALLELADADYALKTGQAGAELLENIVIGLCQAQKTPRRN